MGDTGRQRHLGKLRKAPRRRRGRRDWGPGTPGRDGTGRDVGRRLSELSERVRAHPSSRDEWLRGLGGTTRGGGWDRPSGPSPARALHTETRERGGAPNSRPAHPGAARAPGRPRDPASAAALPPAGRGRRGTGRRPGPARGRRGRLEAAPGARPRRVGDRAPTGAGKLCTGGAGCGSGAAGVRPRSRARQVGARPSLPAPPGPPPAPLHGRGGRAGTERKGRAPRGPKGARGVTHRLSGGRRSACPPSSR